VTDVFAGGGSDGPGALADRVSVFGGTVDFKLGDWMLNAGYSQSNIGLGDSNVVDEDNYAWWAGLGTERERWRMNFGYRQIAPFFGAPGDWGRIGIWWNPTDIEGFYARGSFDLNSKLTVNASGEFYTGTETSVLGITGLTKDDEVSSIKLDLVYKVNQDWDLWLGGEWVKWDLQDRVIAVDGLTWNGGQPEETWYNVGLRYRITDKATWSFRWQMSDYDGDGVSGWNPFSFSGDDRAKGGLITTTLGIRF
jgi:predicted porin